MKSFANTMSVVLISAAALTLAACGSPAEEVGIGDSPETAEFQPRVETQQEAFADANTRSGQTSIKGEPTNTGYGQGGEFDPVVAAMYAAGMGEPADLDDL